MASIEIKITAEVPEGADPKVVALQVLTQMGFRANQLESWQEVFDPFGDRPIGECYFQVIDGDYDDSMSDEAVHVALSSVSS